MPLLPLKKGNPLKFGDGKSGCLVRNGAWRTHTALSQPSDLHPMMTAALISNKPEFVKLFLENGVLLKEFAAWDTLLYLYGNLDPACLFHSKLQKVLAEEPAIHHLQMHHVAQVLRELLGDFTQPLYRMPRMGDRPRPLLPVPPIKLNVSAGNVPPAQLGLCVRPLLCLNSLKKVSSTFIRQEIGCLSELLGLPLQNTMDRAVRHRNLPSHSSGGWASKI